MQLSPEDEQFRRRIREWLTDNLTGGFAALLGAGGPGREHEAHAERVAWNRHLAAAGWTAPAPPQQRTRGPAGGVAGPRELRFWPATGRRA